MKAVLMMLLALAAVSAHAAPLDKTQKTKILFMLFENQNRKTIPSEKKSECSRANTGTWFCENNTVKKFLMNSIGLDADTASKRNNSIQCSEITDANRQKLADEPELGPHPIEFKREITQALKGQWVCNYTYTLLPDANGDNVGHAAATGLSFIMNRSLDRIISKKIVAWSH